MKGNYQPLPRPVPFDKVLDQQAEDKQPTGKNNAGEPLVMLSLRLPVRLKNRLKIGGISPHAIRHCSNHQCSKAFLLRNHLGMSGVPSNLVGFYHSNYQFLNPRISACTVSLIQSLLASRSSSCSMAWRRICCMACRVRRRRF